MADVCDVCCWFYDMGSDCMDNSLSCLCGSSGECLMCSAYVCSECADCYYCACAVRRSLSKCCCDCGCADKRNFGAASRRQPSRVVVSIPPPVAVPIVFLTAKVQPEGPTSTPHTSWGQ